MENSETKFCKHCGAKIAADSAFCEKCGSKLNSSVETTEKPTETAKSETITKTETNIPKTVYSPQSATTFTDITDDADYEDPIVYTIGAIISLISSIVGVALFYTGCLDSSNGKIFGGFLIMVASLVIFVYFFNKMPGRFVHIEGLPIRSGARCTVLTTTQRIAIKAQGATFIIDKSQILDISIQKDVEQLHQRVSSIGGAIAGGVLFGTIGAVVGGRAKVKKIKVKRKVFVITYNKDASIQYVAFQYAPKAIDLVKEFKANNKNTPSKTINL